MEGERERLLKSLASAHSMRLHPTNTRLLVRLKSRSFRDRRKRRFCGWLLIWWVPEVWLFDACKDAGAMYVTDCSEEKSTHSEGV
jgi:hypothetical protein